jgi:hypothetical protein
MKRLPRTTVADVRSEAEALAAWAAATATNQGAVAAIGPARLADVMAALLVGAAQAGKPGFSDRSMLMRMLGQPWATGSAQQQQGKAALADVGTRLTAALNRMEKRLGGPQPTGRVLDVQLDEGGAAADEA